MNQGGHLILESGIGHSENGGGDIEFKISEMGATAKTSILKLDNTKLATFSGNIKIPDSGNIGCTSDTDLLSLASGALTVNGNINLGNTSQINFNNGNATITHSTDKLKINSDLDVDGEITIGTFTITKTGTGANDTIQVSGPGHLSNANNPTIYLMRGQKYKFINNSGSNFYISPTSADTDMTADKIFTTNQGVTNFPISNGQNSIHNKATGTEITFDIPHELTWGGNEISTFYFRVSSLIGDNQHGTIKIMNDITELVPTTSTSTHDHHYITFLGSNSGDQTVLVNSTLKFNPNTGTIFSNKININEILLDTGEATALDIKQDTTSYLKFVTTNGSEEIVVGKDLSFVPGTNSTSSPFKSERTISVNQVAANNPGGRLYIKAGDGNGNATADSHAGYEAGDGMPGGGVYLYAGKGTPTINDGMHAGQHGSISFVVWNDVNGTATERYALRVNNEDGNSREVVVFGNIIPDIYAMSSKEGNANNTLTIGQTGREFNKLFLGSGGVINFNSGNATITHSNNKLKINSDLDVDGKITIGTFTVTTTNDSIRLAGPGNLSSTSNNPTIYLLRGHKYKFINNSGSRFHINLSSGNSATNYTTGVTNNGSANNNASNGSEIIFDVPHEPIDSNDNEVTMLYYRISSLTGEDQYGKIKILTDDIKEIVPTYNNSSNVNHYLVHLGGDAGDQEVRVSDLRYNPSTSTLTAGKIINLIPGEVHTGSNTHKTYIQVDDNVNTRGDKDGSRLYIVPGKNTDEGKKGGNLYLTGGEGSGTGNYGEVKIKIGNKYGMISSESTVTTNGTSEVIVTSEFNGPISFSDRYSNEGTLIASGEILLNNLNENALNIKQMDENGENSYLKFVTTQGSEKIEFGENITFVPGTNDTESYPFKSERTISVNQVPVNNTGGRLYIKAGDGNGNFTSTESGQNPRYTTGDGMPGGGVYLYGGKGTSALTSQGKDGKHGSISFVVWNTFTQGNAETMEERYALRINNNTGNDREILVFGNIVPNTNSWMEMIIIL